MLITLLCQPRSGSTNLANWICKKRGINPPYDAYIEYEPLTNPNLDHYDPEILKKTFDRPYLVIKETYTVGFDYTDLLERSDKVVILYRENKQEHLESFLHAKATGEWFEKWRWEDTYYNESEAAYLFKLRDMFEQLYIGKGYFETTYERLYYRKEIKDLLTYLEWEELYSLDWPFGSKDRIQE